MKYFWIWVLVTLCIAAFVTYLGDYKSIKEIIKHFILYAFLSKGISFLILFWGGLLFFKGKDEPKRDKDEPLFNEHFNDFFKNKKNQ